MSSRCRQASGQREVRARPGPVPSRSPLVQGARFACQGQGCCCKARGPYGYVYLSLEDRRRLAAHLGLPTSSFTRRYCQRTDGEFHLKEPDKDCRFLKDCRCSVYAARPAQCRTWPFWPENMRAAAWREVRATCRGIGRGRLYSAEEIQAIVAKQEEGKSC